jgi:hypothetical protein
VVWNRSTERHLGNRGRGRGESQNLGKTPESTGNGDFYRDIGCAAKGWLRDGGRGGEYCGGGGNPGSHDLPRTT